MASIAAQGATVAASAAKIAQALEEKQSGTIMVESLCTFFSRCADAFGQDSDGRQEASKLIQRLGRGSDSLDTAQFTAYLVRQFSKFPKHLERLSTLVDKETKTDVPEEPTVAVAPSSPPPDESRVHQLENEVNALHAKVQNVNEHHQRMLRAALAAARRERSDALEQGLAEYAAKVRRLETVVAKRDAQIARLRESKSQPRDVRLRSSSQPPMLREGEKELDRSFSSDEDDARLSIRSLPIRRSTSKKQLTTASMAKRAQLDWDNLELTHIPILSPTLSDSSDAETLFALGLSEIDLFSRFNGPFVPSLLVSPAAGAAADNEPPPVGSSAQGFEKLLSAATDYHEIAACVLLTHASRAAERESNPLLQARACMHISRICDARNQLKRAISYAEQAASLFGNVASDPKRFLHAKLHLLTLCMEDQDLDKAELTAMILIDHEHATEEQRQHANRCLAVIRSAVKHGHLLSVDRATGSVSIVVQ